MIDGNRAEPVAGSIEEDDRSQTSLFPERLDYYIAKDNPVRFIDAFVHGLNLVDLKFKGMIMM